jgi:hypothetical protein
MQSFLHSTFVIAFGIPACGQALIHKSKNTLISLFIDLNHVINEPRLVVRLCNDHQIKQRQMYNIMNILVAIRYTSKVGFDKIKYHGRGELVPKMVPEIVSEFVPEVFARPGSEVQIGRTR